MHNSVVPDLDEIAKNVNQIGYYKIKKFLDDKHVSKVINLFPRNVIKKGEEVRIKIPTNFFAFFIKLIKFQFKLIYIGTNLLKLKKKLKYDEIMKEFNQ